MSKIKVDSLKGDRSKVVITVLENNSGKPGTAAVGSRSVWDLNDDNTRWVNIFNTLFEPPLPPVQPVSDPTFSVIAEPYAENAISITVMANPSAQEDALAPGEVMDTFMTDTLSDDFSSIANAEAE